MDDFYDIISEQEKERLSKALGFEYQADLEIQLDRDEQPHIDEPPEKEKLKRDLQREALARLENAARTTDEFNNLVALWDRLDSNRERRERYHEISRSGLDVPFDYGAKRDGVVIPYNADNVLIKQIRKGDFLDAIFYCPFELNELVTDGDLSEILHRLSDEHKEIIFNLIVRGLSTTAFAAVRGQTDRNIRKVRSTAIKKIHKRLLPMLKSRSNNGASLTTDERKFLDKNTALDDCKSG